MDIVKPKLPFLETMVTQACNLSCLGCSNYADLPNKGYVKWDDAKIDLEKWLERIDFLDFGIFGGEPLMNPEIEDWIVGLRKLMPETQIRFTTNGLLLHKKMHIVRLLHDIGNVVFKISNHFYEHKTLNKTIQKIMEMYDWQPVFEYGIERYRTSNNLRFYVRRSEYFLKTYKGEYKEMRPHSNNPVDSFSLCCQQTCPLLYKGKIYKCSTAGLLEDTLIKLNYPNFDEWKPYISKGLSHDCSAQELKSFIDNFGKPNEVCRMCPSDEDTQSKILHLDNVSRKKYAIRPAG